MSCLKVHIRRRRNSSSSRRCRHRVEVHHMVCTVTDMVRRYMCCVILLNSPSLTGTKTEENNEKKK